MGKRAALDQRWIVFAICSACGVRGLQRGTLCPREAGGERGGSSTYHSTVDIPLIQPIQNPPSCCVKHSEGMETGGLDLVEDAGRQDFAGRRYCESVLARKYDAKQKRGKTGQNRWTNAKPDRDRIGRSQDPV